MIQQFDDAYLDQQEVAIQPYSVEQQLEKSHGKIDFLGYLQFITLNIFYEKVSLFVFFRDFFWM